jgi:branched-chain amino acid transport system substrate-binding protein
MFSLIAYSTAIPDDPAQKFLSDYQSAYGSKAGPGANESVPSYNAMYLYKQAVEAAGSVDPESVSKALVGQSFDGPTGTIKMTSSHACSQSLVLVQAKGGTNQFVRMFKGVEPGSQGSCS